MKGVNQPKSLNISIVSPQMMNWSLKYFFSSETMLEIWRWTGWLQLDLHQVVLITRLGALPSWAVHKHRQLVIFQPNLIHSLSDIKINPPAAARPASCTFPPQGNIWHQRLRIHQFSAPDKESLLSVSRHLNSRVPFPKWDCRGQSWRKWHPHYPRWASVSWSTQVNAQWPQLTFAAGGQSSDTPSPDRGPFAQYFLQAFCFEGKVGLQWEVFQISTF